jgi:nucleotide-binding universal stress UspA family protein
MPSRERRLLVPLTGSPEPERVLSTVVGLVEDREATVIAVVVIEVSPLLPLNAEMAEEEAGARQLLARARTVAEAYVHYVPRIVRARKAAAAILELAAEEDAEIVVVDAGGHHLRRAERQLLRKAPGRVLVVPA